MLPAQPIVDRDFKDSSSSFCPDSVDLEATSLPAKSNLADDSSIEETNHADAFAGEEGILHNIFREAYIHCGAANSAPDCALASSQAMEVGA